MIISCSLQDRYKRYRIAIFAEDAFSAGLSEGLEIHSFGPESQEMGGSAPMKVGWVVAELQSSVASTRYRCYYPAISLQRHGVESFFYKKSEEAREKLAELDAVVFVKRLDPGALRLADEARIAGKLIFVDLCDNVVVSSYGKVPSRIPTMTLVAVSAIADAIVTTGSALSETLRPLLSGAARFVEIPDQIETIESVAAASIMAEAAVLGRHRSPAKGKAGRRGLKGPAPRLRERAIHFAKVARGNPREAYHLFRRKLRHFQPRQTGSRPQPEGRVDTSATAAPSAPLKTPGGGLDAAPIRAVGRPRKMVLWFGHFGAPHADHGLLALLQTAQSLRSIARDIDFELVTVTNNRELFDEFIQPIGVNCRYVEWSPEAVFENLKLADVCLLPFGHDPFSSTKSANRAVMALQHGVPVVSTGLASHQPLADAIVFDDWEKGLRRFLGPDAEYEKTKALSAARPVLESIFGPSAIGDAWADLLSRQPRRLRFGRGKTKETTEIGLMLNLPQDLDVLLPVIDELRGREDVFLRVLVAPKVVEKSPRILEALIDRGIIPYALDGDAVLWGEDRVLRDLDALLTASESSLNPHRYAHALTLTANRLGIPTFTVQHGVENIGLSYSDDLHGRDVHFASDRILTWGEVDFPDWVSKQTREKCVSVGRPRNTSPVMPRPPIFDGSQVIAIFENLHWHRYSEAFRSRFVDDLLNICRERPENLILLKPHHAGLYMSRHDEWMSRAPANLLLADPRDPKWEPYTAPAIIPHCAAVVTTPSTVALDAAEIDVPVAVAQYDLDVSAYDPLPMLRDLDDWRGFVDLALRSPVDARLRSRRFAARLSLDGEGAHRIADRVMGLD